MSFYHFTRKGAAALFCCCFILANSPVAVALDIPASAQTERYLGGLSTPAPYVVPRASKPLNTTTQNVLSRQEGEKVLGTLNHLSFNKDTKIPATFFAPLFQPFLQKPVTQSALSSIASLLTRGLRDEGYLLSRVDFTQYDTATQTATFHVSERCLSEVTLKGEDSLINNPITTGVKQRLLGVCACCPLRQTDLENALLVLRALPDTKVQSTIYGLGNDNVGLVISLEQKKWTKILTADNRGTRYNGPFQFGAMTIRNAGNQSFSVRGITAIPYKELHLGQLNYQRVLSDEGTTLNINGLRSIGRPDYTLKALNLYSVNTLLEAEIKHPLMRDRNVSLSTTATLRWRNNKTTILKTPLTQDKILSAEVGVEYVRGDSWNGTTQYGVQFAQGIPFFGASKSGDNGLTREHGRADFSKFTVNIERQQQLGIETNLLLSAQGQYALTQLLSAEQFGFGGGKFGRAYDPSEISGDNGIAFLAEVQRQLPALDNKYITNAQVYASYDVGLTYNIDPSRGRTDTAASLALGWRFNILSNMSVDVQIAKPLTTGVATQGEDNRNDIRGFFGLNIRL